MKNPLWLLEVSIISLVTSLSILYDFLLMGLAFNMGYLVSKIFWKIKSKGE